MPARGTSSRNVVRSDYTRLFLLENSAAPNVTPRYMGFWRANDVKYPFGDIKLIREPSSTQRGAFNTVGDIPGDVGLAALTVQARLSRDRSDLLRMAKRGCYSDVQIHIGTCGNPADYINGWEKVAVLFKGKIPEYAANNLGALDPSERNVSMEDIAFHGYDYYEITRLNWAERASVEVIREITDITVCDSVACGACGITSDGCTTLFAVQKSSGGSPGILMEVLASQDAGATWIARTVTGAAAAQDPNRMGCVGNNMIVLSSAAGGLFWAPLANILASTETWAKVTTGVVSGGEPIALFSPSPSQTWVVGKGGYIYFTNDPTSGLTVQDAGVATIQDYNDVDGFDLLNVVAVGKSNSVAYTRNGGATWAAITGPAVGVDLNCVSVQDENTWWVGTAGGKLFYTINGGTTWVERTFSGSGSGNVADVQFFNNGVGYMAHATAGGVGRIFRTISGGNSWYLSPEGTGSIPSNAKINRIATCEDPNIVYAAGLKSGTDGIILKGA